VVDRVIFNGAVNLKLEREVDIPLIPAEGEYQGQRHLGPPFKNAPRQPQTATLGRTSCLHDEAGEAQSQPERDHIQVAESHTHRCQYKCHYRSHQQHLGHSQTNLQQPLETEGQSLRSFANGPRLGFTLQVLVAGEVRRGVLDATLCFVGACSHACLPLLSVPSSAGTRSVVRPSSRFTNSAGGAQRLVRGSRARRERRR